MPVKALRFLLYNDEEYQAQAHFQYTEQGST